MLVTAMGEGAWRGDMKALCNRIRSADGLRCAWSLLPNQRSTLGARKFVEQLITDHRTEANPSPSPFSVSPYVLHQVGSRPSPRRGYLQSRATNITMHRGKMTKHTSTSSKRRRISGQVVRWISTLWICVHRWNSPRLRPTTLIFGLPNPSLGRTRA